MTYLDSSVALAQLLAEDRVPPESLWGEPLASSRLLQYEVWTRLRARRLERTHAEDAQTLLNRIGFVELTPIVIGRALEPFPAPAWTLDALHLATMDFLRAQGMRVELASYDARLLTAARAIGISPRAL